MRHLKMYPITLYVFSLSVQLVAMDSGFVTLSLVKDQRTTIYSNPLAFSYITPVLASAHDTTLRIFDILASKTRYFPTQHSDPIAALDYAKKYPLLLCGSADTTCSIINTATYEPLVYLHGHTHPITCCAFSDDAHTYVTGSNDGTVRLWNTNRAQEIKILLRGSHPITALSCENYGQLVTWAARGKKYANTLDTRAHTITHTFESSDPLQGLDKMDHIVATASEKGNKGKIELWDIRHLARAYACLETQHPACTVALHPTNRSVTIGLQDGSVIVWDPQAPENNARLITKHPQETISTRYNSTGCILASSSSSGSVKLHSELPWAFHQSLQNCSSYRSPTTPKVYPKELHPKKLSASTKKQPSAKLLAYLQARRAQRASRSTTPQSDLQPLTAAKSWWCVII